MENIQNQIQELEEQIFAREAILSNELYDEGYMILDGEIIDKVTFETIRKTTDRENQYFYEIRLMQLKIKELSKSLPR